MKDRLPYAVTEHDFGVLTALGDPRVRSAANFLSLQASGVVLRPESIDEQQERLAAAMCDHCIDAEDLSMIIAWHTEQGTAYSSAKPERTLDFWNLVARDHRDETGQNGDIGK